MSVLGPTACSKPSIATTANKMVRDGLVGVVRALVCDDAASCPRGFRLNGRTYATLYCKAVDDSHAGEVIGRGRLGATDVEVLAFEGVDPVVFAVIRPPSSLCPQVDLPGTGGIAASAVLGDAYVAALCSFAILAPAERAENC